MIKSVSRIVIAAIVFCLVPVAWAQERTSKDDLKIQDKRILREGYNEKRRQSTSGSVIDRNAARSRAIQQMRNASRSRGGVQPAWVNIGPAPVNGGQTPTNAPRFPSDVTGRVAALAIDPIDNAIYVGAAQGGVWKSTDNGASWTALSELWDSLAIGSVAIDPAPHVVGQATVYAGTGEGNGTGDVYAGVGIYKSTDSGATWTGPLGNAEFNNRSVVSIAVDRNDSNHVFATTASGIFGVGGNVGTILPPRGLYESTDGGLTWTQISTGNFRGSTILQDPITPTTWWVAMWQTNTTPDTNNNGGLLRSTDNGATFVQVAGTGGLPNRTSLGRGWLTATSDGGAPANTILYFASSSSGGQIFKSIDSGTTWTQLIAANGYCNPQCFYDMPIFVEPGNADVLYTGGAGASAPPGAVPSQFMRSDNGGTSFLDKVRSDDMSTAQHADVHAIITWPGQPNRLWVGNDGGVWRSDDRGDNWVNVNNNLAITQFSGGDIDPLDPGRAYAGTQDNGTMGWQGTDNWKHLDFGDGGFAEIDQGDPDNLVHTYFNQSGGLIGVGWTTNGFATTQGFYNFSSAQGGNGIVISDRVLFYAPIHLDNTPSASDTLYFGTNRLYIAPDFFVNAAAPNHFSLLNGGLDLTDGVGGAISAIMTVPNAVEGGNSQIIFTGASSGEVNRSIDGGASFTQVDDTDAFVSDIAVDPRDSNIVYQSISGFFTAAGPNVIGEVPIAERNIRKSIDGGVTWADSAVGLPAIPVNALVVDPVVEDRVWAGTDIGMYVSNNSGANWEPYPDGFPKVAVFDLKGNAATDSIVAFTHGRSAFRLSPLVSCFETTAAALSAIYDSLGNGEWPIQQNMLDYVSILNNVCAP